MIGMFHREFVNSSGQAHPIFYVGNVSKRYTGLTHAIRTRIQSEEDNLFAAINEPTQVGTVHVLGIFQRIVDDAAEMKWGKIMKTQLYKMSRIYSLESFSP